LKIQLQMKLPRKSDLI